MSHAGEVHGSVGKRCARLVSGFWVKGLGLSTKIAAILVTQAFSTAAPSGSADRQRYSTSRASLATDASISFRTLLAGSRADWDTQFGSLIDASRSHFRRSTCGAVQAQAEH